MRRILLITAALSALLAGATAARATDTPSADLPLARLAACDVTGSQRSAVFYARMAAIPGASRMQLRFTVLEKLGRSDDWSKLDVPELRQWHRSAPGVKTFGYRQTVANLRTGGAYKAHVQYRWTTAAGAVVDTLTRDTAVCRGPLPNLAVGGLEIRPGPTPDTRDYRVTVVNDGKGDADAVRVVLNVDHAVLDAATIDQLAAGDSRLVTFTGPGCNHAARVRIDPDNTIGETSDDDNSQLFGCS